MSKLLSNLERDNTTCEAERQQQNAGYSSFFNATMFKKTSPLSRKHGYIAIGRQLPAFSVDITYRCHSRYPAKGRQRLSPEKCSLFVFPFCRASFMTNLLSI